MYFIKEIHLGEYVCKKKSVKQHMVALWTMLLDAELGRGWRKQAFIRLSRDSVERFHFNTHFFNEISPRSNKNQTKNSCSS